MYVAAKHPIWANKFTILGPNASQNHVFDRLSWRNSIIPSVASIVVTIEMYAPASTASLGPVSMSNLKVVVFPGPVSVADDYSQYRMFAFRKMEPNSHRS